MVGRLGVGNWIKGKEGMGGTGQGKKGERSDR